MSNLEELSKPWLVNMMKGRKRTMFPPTQRIVATWAYKTGLMLHQASMTREERLNDFIPPAHYRHLYERAEPPPSVHVGVWHYSGDWVHMHGRVTSVVIPIKNHLDVVQEQARAYVITILLGNLVFLVTGLHALNPATGLRLSVGDADTEQPVSLAIWPPPLVRRIDWPPAESIDDARFATLGDAIKRALMAFGG